MTCRLLVRHGAIDCSWSVALNREPVVAVLLFEYLVTFDQEILAIWKRKYTFATWLFVANRYLVILYGIMLLLADQVTGQLVSAQSFMSMLCSYSARGTFKTTANIETHNSHQHVCSCTVVVRFFEALSLTLTVIFGRMSGPT